MSAFTISNSTPIDVLLNLAQEKLGLKTRTMTHDAVGITAPLCSKVRHGKANVSAEMILRLHDATGLSVDEIRERLGVKKFAHWSQTNAKQAGDQQPAQN